MTSRAAAWQAGVDRASRWGAILLGFSIPISVALDNLLLALLAALFVLGGRYRDKLARIRENPVAVAAARAIEVALPPSGRYESELGLAGQAWIGALAAMLEVGVILIVDYGFPAREYYHPQRSMGTLMCHYRHRAHGDPFYLPGLQDITAHVDFSALAHAAADAGLDVLGYASQADFLLNCGLTDILGEANARDVRRYAPRPP